jgi:hypothetical protein
MFQYPAPEHEDSSHAGENLKQLPENGFAGIYGHPSQGAGKGTIELNSNPKWKIVSNSSKIQTLVATDSILQENSEFM